MEILLADFQDLTVIRTFEEGYILGKNGIEVFLHKNEATDNLTVDEEVNVFVYKDHQGRLTGTMFEPKATVNTYGWCEVVKVIEGLGVFVNIGTTKDVLIEKNDLPVFEDVWPIEGDSLCCTIKVTKANQLLGKLATENYFIDNMSTATDTMFNKTVNGRIVRNRKVGVNIFTDEGFYGFIHESEMVSEPRLGEKVSGRIIDVKEDGQINVSLLPRKQEAISDDVQKILEYMDSRGGAMPFSDKSQPEDIAERFNISKAAFKRALGTLMKEGKIYQENSWTYYADKK
ncbi:MAG: hypothetical protein K0S34_1835 [Bacillales bacterium]|jgi:predicted RNA-binding protein (virulence factor B family)|nr:hypothetical protein [Bacillales bacterium]